MPGSPTPLRTGIGSKLDNPAERPNELSSANWRTINPTACNPEDPSGKPCQKRRGIPDRLELTEETSWSRGINKYSRLNTKSDLSTSSGCTTPMQALDARTLLKHPGCISSTPASSLDLEWEHEVLPMPTVRNSEGAGAKDSPSRTSHDSSQHSSLTASPWSRISSPNSLEWDPAEADIASVDVETEQLLTEIERLTDKALKETGDWSGTS